MSKASWKVVSMLHRLHLAQAGASCAEELFIKSDNIFVAKSLWDHLMDKI